MKQFGNSNSTMETRDHSKNGASSKSQTSRINKNSFIIFIYLFFFCAFSSYAQVVYQVGSRGPYGGIVFSVDTYNRTVSEMYVIDGRYTYTEAMQIVQQTGGWNIPTISELITIYNNLHKTEKYKFTQKGSQMGEVWSTTAGRTSIHQQTVEFNRYTFSDVWVRSSVKDSRIFLIAVLTSRN